MSYRLQMCVHAFGHQDILNRPKYHVAIINGRDIKIFTLTSTHILTEQHNNLPIPKALMKLIAYIYTVLWSLPHLSKIFQQTSTISVMNFLIHHLRSKLSSPLR